MTCLPLLKGKNLPILFLIALRKAKIAYNRIKSDQLWREAKLKMTAASPVSVPIHLKSFKSKFRDQQFKHIKNQDQLQMPNHFINGVQGPVVCLMSSLRGQLVESLMTL